MPIFTLRLKSMPSTNSRKPWTKCWRDCSPSVTMSMPASSCSLSQSRVASRFARSSSAPAPRHAGQSFFGSASHSGLGRLPAMVVFSMVFGCSCRDFGTATKSRYANIIRGDKQCSGIAPNGGGFLVALGVIVGTFVSFVLGIFNPYVVNKAGPDWMWTGGRDDVIRNLYFKPNGSFRRYGRAALLATLSLGPVALYWLLTHA